jgi:ubiquinone/menaquinone biosynthesis C-methylase UbiE
MNLGELNRKYWSQYEAGSTPGVNEKVPDLGLLGSLPTNAHTLDVGTGTGRIADYLADMGFDSYGIDINEKEINENSKRGSAQYSSQDIAGTTTFSDAFFSLVVFRYTLTNIHKDQWSDLSKEVNRITMPGGFLWLAEPQVNQAYADRYTLGNLSLGDEHAFYVFKDKSLAEKIKEKAALDETIAKGGVARIVRHYDKGELLGLFPNFEEIAQEYVNDTSPSGYPLDTIILTLQKTGQDSSLAAT